MTRREHFVSAEEANEENGCDYNYDYDNECSHLFLDVPIINIRTSLFPLIWKYPYYKINFYTTYVTLLDLLFVLPFELHGMFVALESGIKLKNRLA
jgi:hypothetical protein